jgi:predicted nucleic acid-binding protein
MMKAYLDNDIVSAIAKNDKPEEADALRRLLQAKDEGKVRLVTSALTLEEIRRYQGAMRPELEETFQLFEKVEVIPSDQLIGMQSYGDSRTWITMPMIEKHADYKALRELGVKPVDAEHVFVASRHDCDAFLTCDGGILHHDRAAAIDKRFGMLVRKSSVFVASQGW